MQPEAWSCRILQVFNRYLERGGEEIAVERIQKYLEGVPGVTVHTCEFLSADWSGPAAPPAWKQAAGMILNRKAIEQLRAMHKEYRPDVWIVHNVFPVGSAGVYREARDLRVPIVYFTHNFRPFSVNGYLWAGDRLALGGLQKRFREEVWQGAWQGSRLKSAWFALVLHWLHRSGWLRSVKSWVAISEFMRSRFIEAGIPQEDIFTVRHPWEPMPTVAPQEDGGYYLFLGRLITAKGVRVLLDAWQIIERECPATTPRLVIAGPGPLAAEVKRRSGELRSVRYAGVVAGEEKAALLRGCRALVVPSIWWEPLGLVIYEAYDCEKPVLAARSGGLQETVVDGETGRLHEPGNAAELAAHVLAMERNPEQRVQMGHNGRRWLVEHTGVDQWLKQLRHAVEHAMASGGKVPAPA